MNIASKSSFVLNKRHLLGIEGLSHAEISGLLDLGEEFVELNRQVEKKRTSLRGRAGQRSSAAGMHSAPATPHPASRDGICDASAGTITGSTKVRIAAEYAAAM